MKKLFKTGIIAALVIGTVFASCGCSKKEESTELAKSDESTKNYLHYGKKLFSDEFLDITLDKIQSDGVYLKVKNHSSKEKYSFSIKALALDGRVQYQYINILCGTDDMENVALNPGSETEVIKLCDIGSSYAYKKISIIFQLSDADDKLIETKEVVSNDLGEPAHKYGEYSDSELLHSSDHMTIWYSNIHSAGLYFHLKNKTNNYVTISYCYHKDENNGQDTKNSNLRLWIPAECSTSIVACSSAVVESGEPGQFLLKMYRKNSNEVIEEVTIPYSEIQGKYDVLGENWK